MLIQKWSSALVLIICSASAGASSITINYDVSALDSLFYTDWGHAYNVSGAGNEYDALNRGVAADNVDYAFTSGQALSISATGCVRDAGRSCTDADGYDHPFRGLDVYSLIGIWSGSDTEINPIGDTFVLGSDIDLIAPQYDGLLYLFLGENDGIFADNYSCNFHHQCFAKNYHVSITTTPSAVPVPAAMWLFGSGLLGLIGVAKRKNKV